MNFNEFTLLTIIEKEQRIEIDNLINKSHLKVEEVENIISKLREEKLINKSNITKEGYKALEPYRVKRAIFIAAGFGSRMVPLTYNTPKPLIRVHGKRMIDTLLDAVLAAGINDIYVVRGYLGEEFDVLLRKYPMIKFIENPTYNEANNIGSVVKARELLDNAYVFEADLVLSNPDLITKYQYRSNYLGIYKEHSDDWCFETNAEGKITGLVVVADKTYQMVGISYWTKQDGEKLKDDVVKVFNMEGGKQKYWDEVALRFYKENYDVYVRECLQEDIVEIDSFEELKVIDELYK